MGPFPERCFYNQGNAWMRAKQPGRAIAAYRQAQRYRPAIHILMRICKTHWDLPPRPVDR